MKNKSKIFFAVFLFLILMPVYAEPANDSFLDDNLYNCIIDAYNLNKEEKKDYTYSILPEELIAITSLDCSSYSGKIEDLTGLNKLTSLTSINISGNTFIGGAITLQINETGLLKSIINLPSQLSLTDVTYTIDNNKIVSVIDGVVTGLTSGSTYITMSAKVTGNIVTEKYLVSVKEDENAKKSNNNYLSSITLSKGEINFSKDITSYTVVVSKNTNSVTISAELEDSTASYVTNYAPRKVSLKEGSNTFYIKVKAANGEINVYTIMIVRSDGNDDNNMLSNIVLSTGEINFKSTVTNYNLNVEYDVEKIEVIVTTESLLATAVVSDTALDVGENTISITVTAENGNEKVYELNVYREGYESSKNYLKALNIKGYSINFSKDVLNYNIKINNEDSLNIVATQEKSSSSISIVGNKNLKNNSIIKITVTDEDNINREYTITISKPFIYELSFEMILLFIEFIIIFILLLIVIFSPKKKAKKKNRVIPKNKICSNCKTINTPNSKVCYVCGRPFE